MSIDILGGRWKQIRANAKEWWGKHNDNDLDHAPNRREQLVSALQKKHGYSRAQAGEGIDRRLKEYDYKRGQRKECLASGASV
jgi:uncharacterized protein YjbJ (UPF0337 family)